MHREREGWMLAVRYSSLATLAGLIPHYAASYLFQVPLLTDRIAEWIMAYTPSRYAVPILNGLGAWAKPWASTGALAILGFGIFLARFLGNFVPVVHRVWVTLTTGLFLAVVIARVVHYPSVSGFLLFWIPALLAALFVHQLPYVTTEAEAPVAPLRAERRLFLEKAAKYGLPIAMGSGTIAVAVESYLRNEALARSAVAPVNLFPFLPPLDRQRFGGSLVRKEITPVSEFYGMSKNTVDPNIDPRQWRLRITFDGRPVRTWTYAELLALPRQRRYQTLRCISNTLRSDLMGTAEWAGVHLSQLVDRRMIPAEAIEAAFIGVEGHDDSLLMDYAFGEEAMLALGMNGKTLSRTHGFPVRLLAPRFYGCRNVKWIGEIRFVTKPYYGTWQRMGYTKNPVIHIASHIDHQQRTDGRVRCGGVSFAGDCSIRAVRLRVNRGSWGSATLESPLSPYTWTRWTAEFEAQPGDLLEANAQAQDGRWQELAEGNPFPNGLTGPTIIKVAV